MCNYQKFLVYEQHLRGTNKPDHNSERSEKEDFIFQKYKHRAFISSSTLEVTFFTDLIISVIIQVSSSNICDAVYKSDVPLLLRLLAFASPQELNSGGTARNETPLHIAAFHGNIVCLQVRFSFVYRNEIISCSFCFGQKLPLKLWTHQIKLLLTLHS